MLEDIKKILDVAKKGIVVMENGKPSYVIMQFDDYVKTSEGNVKNLLSENMDEKEIDEMIEREIYGVKDKDLYDVFDEIKDIDSIKKDMREIRLEDLPF